MAKIKATIFFERKYWVATFERIDKEGYAVARHIFGGEPTDPEIHQFILENYTTLHFGRAQKIEVEIKRMNPKRQQRVVRKEMEQLKQTQRPSTFAQDVMREDLEQNRKEKKRLSTAEKRRQQEERFSQKREKRKEKKRGH